MQNFIRLNHKVQYNERIFWFSKCVYWVSSTGLGIAVHYRFILVMNIAKTWEKYAWFKLYLKFINSKISITISDIMILVRKI